MTNVNKFTVSIGDITHTLKSFQNVFGGHTDNNLYTFDNSYCKGHIMAFHLLPKVEMLVHEGYFNEQILIERLPRTSQNCITIAISLNKNLKFDSELNNSNSPSASSVIIHNEKLPFELKFDKGSHAQWIIFHMDVALVEETSAFRNHKKLPEILFKQEAFFLIENITWKMEQYFQDVFKWKIGDIGIVPKIHARGLDLLHSIFMMLFQREQKDYEVNVHTQDFTLLMNIRDEISANIGNPITIEALAKEHCMSTSKLRKLFKNVFGMPFRDYVFTKKMEKAASLISEGLSMAEIAYMLGYSNPSKFSSAFQKYHGILPIQFKSKINAYKEYCLHS